MHAFLEALYGRRPFQRMHKKIFWMIAFTLGFGIVFGFIKPYQIVE